MQIWMILLLMGVAIMITGISLFISSKYNRIFPCLLFGIGGVFIGLAIFLVRNPQFIPNSYKGDFNDPPSQEEVCEEVSMEVGMTMLVASSDDIENIENHVNTPIYFQDGDSIYKCDVVFENNERNYYFTSGENSVQLYKNVTY